MRWIATGLLVVVAILFGITRTMEPSVPALGWLRAFSEAAMVGALADWFAVVALFRHPLGLPIPHTALIRKNKATIAASISNFIVDNFLTRQIISERLHSIRIADRLAQWLQQNASSIASIAVNQLPVLLPHLDRRAVENVFQQQLTRWVDKIEVAPLVGKALPQILTPARFDALLQEIVKFTQSTLRENQATVTESIRKEIPVPDQIMGFPLHGIKESVSQLVAQKVVEKIGETLNEVVNTPSHPIRIGIMHRIATFMEELRTSGDYLAKGEELKKEWLTDQQLQTFSKKIWEEIEAFILSDCAAPDSHLRTTLTALIDRLGTVLRENEAFRATFEVGLCNLLAEVIEKNAHAARSIIEETVNSWDAEDMSQKLELEMGPDLQFIRLNGTVIGGLVGVVIHALSLLLWGR